ncbi:MAG: hypothetical protein IJ125_01630 [Atopobiaceae bacterium]|nr:hypothetical protein [Atopobiaceae bacterium]
MAQLLIRDVPIKTKQALQMRAIRNGRTQNAEALRILSDALFEEREPWIDMLGRARDAYGGVDLELPARGPARDFSFEE